MISVSLRVNHREERVSIEPRTSLADCLRETLLLTGTHLGCEHGVCGACTVMLDGRPIRSCITLTVACEGASVVTIEGFEDDELMEALRAAFSRQHALQCGYCTPGMLATAYDIVRRLPDADVDRISLELAGNLCRCTGYRGIVEAIAAVIAAPPAALVVPGERHGIATAELAAVHATASAAPSVTADGLAGGVTIERSVPLAAPADEVWPLLRSVERLAGLLPGAALDSVDGDRVTGRFVASLGPIKASFRGEAVVSYDDAARAGGVVGGGGDQLTRTTASGALSFRLHSTGASTSVVALTLTYRLSGPLAQFGRPAIVAGVVDQVLARLADNLVVAAGGVRQRRSFWRWLRQRLGF